MSNFRKTPDGRQYMEYEIHNVRLGADEFGFGVYNTTSHVYISDLFKFVDTGNFAMRINSSNAQNFKVKVFQGSEFEDKSTYLKTFEKTYNAGSLDILETISLAVPSSSLYVQIEFTDITNLVSLFLTFLSY